MNFKRKILSISGSAGVALSSLLMSIVLIQNTSSEDYGFFAFILIAQALSIGFSNALLGSPLMIILSKAENADEKIKSYMLANLIIGLFVFLAQTMIAFNYTGLFITSFLYGVAGFFWFIRWFGRLYYDFKLENDKVVRCDIVYSIISFFGVGFIYFFNSINLLNFAIIIAVSSLTSLLLIGNDFIKSQLNCFTLKSFKPFVDGFHSQGKHSLIGVTSTELTANAHVYLIIATLGPLYFAPIAAAMLLYRPMTIIHATLIQIELPRFRQKYLTKKQNFDNALLINFFKYNTASFLVVFISIQIFLVFYGANFWPEKNTYESFVQATYVFSMIVFVRCLKIPYSVSLQAQDRFSELSRITIASSLVSLPASFLFLYFSGPVASLFGVLSGDVVALLLVYLKCQKGNNVRSSI